MLTQEINFLEPHLLFRHFAEKTGSVLLDSALPQENNRFSFIGIDPFLTVQSKDQNIFVGEEIVTGNPFDYLKKLLDQYHFQIESDVCPFQGGMIGYFGFELYKHLEVCKNFSKDEMQLPDLSVGFYDLVIGFDLKRKKAWIFSSGFPEKDSLLREKRAVLRRDFLLLQIDNMLSSRSLFLLSSRALSTGSPSGGPTVKPRDDNIIQVSQSMPRDDSMKGKSQDLSQLLTNFTRETYQAIVKKAIQYIVEGDIFQVNLSQRFTTLLEKSTDIFALYEQLRAINPAPYAAYLNLSPISIISASPERFLRLQKNKIETKPIKGTSKRGKTLQEDQKLANTLLASEKNRAENIMIVDLMRNDFSRVCKTRSVQVPQLCALESFATVHHLVSKVTGELLENKNAIDVLKACFPAGSVTGAPKIRALEIISELEKTTRGPYCGNIGYIGFNGDMDLSVTIRTMIMKNNTVIFQTGGAIVSDSDPEQEYEETLLKAGALIEVLATK